MYMHILAVLTIIFHCTTYVYDLATGCIGVHGDLHQHWACLQTQGL